MSSDPTLPLAPRRPLAAILLATSAAACLLGGCMQTSKLGGGLPSSDVQQMSASEAADATAKWASAYARKPQDAKIAYNYAKALRAIGSRDRAIEVLTTAYQANPDNGELSAELGRLALEAGRLDIAKATLKTAEAKGVRDWKTLSAQGTLHAKQGDHAQAQQYFLAALQEKPDAVSVINNLALSYALDGKAKKSEQLLRKAVASGHEDKRVRQNLALVLGLQGKFDEARQVASVDLSEDQARSSMSYLRNMVTSPTQLAAREAPGDDNWSPFADTAAAKPAAPARTATAAASPVAPKTQTAAPTAALKPSMAPAPVQTAAKTTTQTKTASAAPSKTPQAKPAPTSAQASAAAAPMDITPPAGDSSEAPKSGWLSNLFRKN